MKYIAITGLYRSSTTFIEKSLDSQDGIDVLHQPVNLFFKIVDELIWTQLKGKDWPALPMGYEAFWDIYDKYSLEDINFDQAHIDRMVQESRSAAVNHPGKNSVLFPQVAFYDILAECVSPANAQEVMNGIFQAIARYRKNDVGYVGFKEIFLTPYFPMMAEDENLYLIHVIRDPREIYFSRNYNSQKELFGSLERHPVKMIAEIWRNHILLNRHMKAARKNVVEVYYDDIRENSDAAMAKLLNEIGYSSSNVDELKDESGQSWKINTSDKEGKPGFGKKWAEEMDPKQIAVIEHICGDLMEELGYARFINVDECESIAKSYEEDLKTLKTWTQREELYRL